MRKGLIFYVLSGICALSSIVTLSSCSSANADNTNVGVLPSYSSNINEPKEEEFMADYTDLETFRNDVINGIDVVGKTLKLVNDNLGYCYNGLESYRIIWKDIQFDCQIDDMWYTERSVIQIKIKHMRKTVVTDYPIQYFITYDFYQMDPMDSKWWS